MSLYLHITAASRRRRGFTLVEILTVVLILGIIASIVGIQMGSRSDIRCAAAARVLTSNLQYAQTRATVRREPHYVVVNGSTVSIQTASASGLVALDHPVDQQPMSITFGDSTSGTGEGIDLVSHDFEGKAMLAFDEMGNPLSCDADGSDAVPLATAATLVLRSGETTMTVRVEPFTGEITID